MKKILLCVYTYIKKLSFKDWIIIIISCIAIFFGIKYHYYYKKTLYPTVIYNNDSIKIYKDKLNTEYKQKTLYVLTIDLLKENNSKLYSEIKNLKDDVFAVTKTKVVIKIDTVPLLSDSIIEAPKDSVYNLYWHNNETNGYYSIAGNTKVKYDFSSFATYIESLKITGELTVDVIEKDKKFSVIAKTDNPYINISNIDGVIIDPTKSSVMKSYFKQKHWSIGPMIGYGLTSSFKLQPYIGVGISYGIIHF